SFNHAPSLPATPPLLPYTTLFRSLDQLRTHVLEAVFQLYFLGNGNAVLGDQRSTEAALDQNVAALRPQGGLDRVGQNVNPFQHLDRKSTRLNSSHVKISYAVFCLK